MEGENMKWLKAYAPTFKTNPIYFPDYQVWHKVQKEKIFLKKVKDKKELKSILVTTEGKSFVCYSICDSDKVKEKEFSELSGAVEYAFEYLLAN